MRKLLLFSAFFIPSISFAQFNSKNQLGVGLNIPTMVAARDFLPFPIVQFDYKHEFFFGTRNPNVEKSMELRIGFGVSSFLSKSFYMLNVGFQSSFVQTQYLHAWGCDFLGYDLNVRRNLAEKVLGTTGTGKGNGMGMGLFYKFGRSMGKSFSITTEIGVAATYDYYSASYGGPVMWESGYTPNVGLYRGNISLNYHF